MAGSTIPRHDKLLRRRNHHRRFTHQLVRIVTEVIHQYYPHFPAEFLKHIPFPPPSPQLIASMYMASSSASVSWADPENFVRWGVLTFSVCFLVISLFHGGPYEPPSRNNSLGLIASRGRSIPVCLKKPIATCDFPAGESGTPVPHSGSALVYIPLFSHTLLIV